MLITCIILYQKENWQTCWTCEAFPLLQYQPQIEIPLGSPFFAWCFVQGGVTSVIHSFLFQFFTDTRRYFSRRIGCYWPTDCPIYSLRSRYKKWNQIILLTSCFTKIWFQGRPHKFFFPALPNSPPNYQQKYKYPDFWVKICQFKGPPFGEKRPKKIKQG